MLAAVHDWWPPSPGIYAIVDVPHPLGLSLVEQVSGLLAGGVAVLQLRAKEATTRERITMLEAIAPLCAATKCPLFVNDDVEAVLAKVPGVSGVHVGQEDWRQGRVQLHRATMRDRGLLLGLSTHSIAQVCEAQQLGVDLLGFGPVYRTSTKSNPEPITGLAALREACQISGLPVVAIGGITEQTVGSCADAGATFVAMIAALVGATQNETAAKAMAARRQFARENRPVA